MYIYIYICICIYTYKVDLLYTESVLYRLSMTIYDVIKQLFCMHLQRC